MSSLYCWLYFLISLGWTGFALSKGWYNCIGKQWALELALPVNATVFGVGAVLILGWRWARKKSAIPVPTGELLLFSLVVSLAGALTLFFILPMLHQTCC